MTLVGRRARVLAVVAAVLGVVAAGCGGDGAPPSPEPAAAGPITEANFFFACRDRLGEAPPDLAGAIKVGIGSFAQPSGRAVQPGEPSLTLGFSLTYIGQGPEIVILDVIPWKVGDIEQGPGARLTKTKRYGLTLKPGERASVDIPVIVDRVEATSTATVPSSTGPAGGVPGPTPSAGPTRSLGGSGVLAAATQGPETTSSSSATTPTPNPSASPAPRPLPSGTPLGPQPPPQKGGPFDPEAGVQVIIVAAFVGEGVAADAFGTVQPVPCDQVPALYGRFTRIAQGIAVPLDRLL